MTCTFWGVSFTSGVISTCPPSRSSLVWRNHARMRRETISLFLISCSKAAGVTGLPVSKMFPLNFQAPYRAGEEKCLRSSLRAIHVRRLGCGALLRGRRERAETDHACGYLLSSKISELAYANLDQLGNGWCRLVGCLGYFRIQFECRNQPTLVFNVSKFRLRTDPKILGCDFLMC